MSAKKSTQKPAATKKTTKKAPAKSKKEITGKSIGQNVILIIDGKKYSKKVAEKTQREFILGEKDAYNKRNTLKRENEIIEFMLSGKTTPKERKKAVTKKVPKKVAKPKAKAVSTKEIEAAKALLVADGYTISKNAPNVKPRRTSNREY